MGAYFSNGTEGNAWESAWCASCTQDHAMTHVPGGGDDGCQIFLRAIVGEEVPEWSRRDGPPFVLPPDVVCSEYVPCELDECSGDPQPDARAGARARVAEALS